MFALDECDRSVCSALHSPLASPTASLPLTPFNTGSHFVPLCDPIVVTPEILSRGISQLEKVFLNRSESRRKIFRLLRQRSKPQAVVECLRCSTSASGQSLPKHPNVLKESTRKRWEFR